MTKINLKSISLAALAVAGTAGFADPAFAQATGGTGAGDPATEVCTQNTTISAVACGTNSVAQGFGTAVGNNANASRGNSTAIGYSAEANSPSSVALGNSSVADQINTVSVGSASSTSGFQRRIVNVAAGTGEFDAVNAGQLNRVSSLAGLAQANAATAQNNANTALSNASSALAQNVAQDARLSAIEVLNNEQNNRFSALEAVTNNVGGRISNLELESRQSVGGIAAAMAMGGAVIVPDATVSMSFNLATYRGEQGFSGSVIGKVAPKVYISGGFAGSTVKGSTGGRVGITFGM